MIEQACNKGAGGIDIAKECATAALEASLADGALAGMSRRALAKSPAARPEAAPAQPPGCLLPLDRSGAESCC